MAKSCYPPSEIGARFATAEALASQRSYFVEIPSNSVAASPQKQKGIRQDAFSFSIFVCFLTFFRRCCKPR